MEEALLLKNVIASAFATSALIVALKYSHSDFVLFISVKSLIFLFISVNLSIHAVTSLTPKISNVLFF